MRLRAGPELFLPDWGRDFPEDAIAGADSRWDIATCLERVKRTEQIIASRCLISANAWPKWLSLLPVICQAPSSNLMKIRGRRAHFPLARRVPLHKPSIDTMWRTKEYWI